MQRLFHMGDTPEKVKTMIAWAILSFIFPGMLTIYRWFSWLFADYPNYYYLERGWLYTMTTLNLGMMLWLAVLLFSTYMLRDYYRNRREVIREVDEIIEPVEPKKKWLIKLLTEKPPVENEDYHAEMEERDFTEEQLLKHIQQNKPTSLEDCDMLLSQLQDENPSKTIQEAKMILLNYRKKWTRNTGKSTPAKKTKKVFDLTDA